LCVVIPYTLHITGFSKPYTTSTLTLDHMAFGPFPAAFPTNRYNEMTLLVLPGGLTSSRVPAFILELHCLVSGPRTLSSRSLHDCRPHFPVCVTLHTVSTCCFCAH
jgi:hypothetical protein